MINCNINNKIKNTKHGFLFRSLNKIQHFLFTYHQNWEATAAP